MRLPKTEAKARIVEVLKSAAEPMNARDIAGRVYADAEDGGPLSMQSRVSSLIGELRREGHPIRTGRRMYLHGYTYEAVAAPIEVVPKAATVTVWTDAMTATLKSHAWGRSKPAAIAAMLGVSERAVITKAAKIGVKFNSSLERPVRERIADLAAQGWRPSRIARQVGLDPDLVALHLPPVSPCRASSPASPAG